MFICSDNIVSFTPDHSRSYVAVMQLFKRNDENVFVSERTYVIPVIAWAIVARGVFEEEVSDESTQPSVNAQQTRLEPVVIGNEGRPETITDFRDYINCNEQYVSLSEVKLCDEETWVKQFESWWEDEK